MDKKAFYKLSYGVFMLATKSGDKVNGCIINTCIQCGSNPDRVSIACINGGYTCELIKESGVFTVSVLDETATFDLIKNFGMQTGRDTDKFAGIPVTYGANKIPMLKEHCCATMSCKVTESYDIGSHTIFIATVEDCEPLNDKNPLTYADYQTKVKPKPAANPQTEKKIVAWKCTICGYIYEGAEIPDDFICPLCGHGKEDFVPVYEE